MTTLPQGNNPIHRMTRKEIVLKGKEREVGHLVMRGFTNRQAEVAIMLSLGIGNEEIADNLCIASKTVRFHLTAIYRLLEVPTRYAAIVQLKIWGI